MDNNRFYLRLAFGFFFTAVLLLPGAPGASASQGGVASVSGVELEAGAGVRVDQFDWSIAGNLAGTSPDVLSELTWTDLEILEFRVRGRKTANTLYLRGSFNFGFIYAGTNRDSDYNGDNRTLEFSRSDNGADNGTVWDLSLGAGYSGWSLKAGNGTFRLRPLIGYSFHKQNLTITDGSQTIPPTGPFSGLNSTYRASWMGPWAGVDADYSSGYGLRVYGIFEMHAAAYRATANWNLRGDFQHPVSFEQTANGIGVVLELGVDYGLSRSWSVAASLKHQDWHAFAGTDRTFFSSGLVSDTRLNEVNWSSDALMIGLGYAF